MFHDLPSAIGDFQLQNLNTGPDFTNAEVLLELVEHRVVLPIVAYSRLKRPLAEHFVLKFNQTQFAVERVLFDLSKKMEEEGRIQAQETVRAYPITAVAEAVEGLAQIVIAQIVGEHAGHPPGCACQMQPV